MSEKEKTNLTRGSVSQIGNGLKRSRVAIYLQLADLFRNRISSGFWPVGSRIPNIDELEQEFSVARGTIRQAFELLKAEGLIDQRRAKGSFVLRAPASISAHRLDMDWASITKAHQGADIKTLATNSDVQLPDLLKDGSQEAASYHWFKRLHRRDGQVYLLGSSYLDEELFGCVKPSRFESEPLLVLLQEAAAEKLGAANQILTISVADVDVAATMEIPLNSPLVVMHRFVHASDGKLIYASEGYYRGDAVRLEMNIR
ncbi:GntR family transcriptional regulator [Paenochrobactrum gallinarii]|uniref:GntR family transcriptional regulator n=1 Tax=Paenochrobactrum gallinarii TaxID=643673 RepID=A0A841M1C0_9HYPH|nr:GntR family transcriptional regulator [Paenochrobactrum gallinarii]MBB6262547.1 GntR family transcriptional regulator [Paenochrobactrum gallinarii]